MAQDSWQAYYQILSIILLKEFMKLNVNTDNNKKCETCGIKFKKFECFPGYTNFKDNLMK